MNKLLNFPLGCLLVRPTAVHWEAEVLLSPVEAELVLADLVQERVVVRLSKRKIEVMIPSKQKRLPPPGNASTKSLFCQPV